MSTNRFQQLIRRDNPTQRSGEQIKPNILAWVIFYLSLMVTIVSLVIWLGYFGIYSISKFYPFVASYIMYISFLAPFLSIFSYIYAFTVKPKSYKKYLVIAGTLYLVLFLWYLFLTIGTFFIYRDTVT